MNARYFLLKRKDGTASLMTSFVNVDEAVAKWSESMQAEYTGEYLELTVDSVPKGADRHKWKDGVVKHSKVLKDSK